jgi:hypothetical protein
VALDADFEKPLFQNKGGILDGMKINYFLFYKN